MRTSSRIALGLAAALVIAGTFVLLRHARRGHAFQPSLESLDTSNPIGWVPYGGAWKTFEAGMQNNSEERGAKLMNGSPDWSNYFVEADVQLLGPYGDAGLLLRSSGEEEGVDAYHGYYAILRNMNDTLTIGRSDFGLDQFVISPIVPQIGDQEWFHLKFIAYDCDIVATATSSSGKETFAAAHDPRCIAKGRFGLRSFSTSARWKNIRVGPATRQDIDALTRHTTLEKITYTSDSVRSVVPPADVDRYRVPIRREAKRLQFDLDNTSIEDLSLLNLNETKNVTIHGVVTLVSPDLYIQDVTGGIKVPQAVLTGPVKIGDEAEARGQVISRDFHPALDHATIRVLSSNVPVPALTVTAFELAVGNHDGHFVEVEGELQSLHSTPDDRLVLELADGSQRFYAIADRAEWNFRNKELEVGSRLRLRGIESLDTRDTNNLVSFAILLPTADSVDVIKAPPWWTTQHIVLVALLCLILFFGLIILFNRLQHWKLESILDERERLALEMHDTLAQSFAGIGFQLHAILEKTKNDPPVQKQVTTALSMVRTSHEEAKKSIAALRPRFLNNNDLVNALKQAAERSMEGQSVTILTQTSGSVDEIPLRTADSLFRIGQEAINNAVRHSEAHSIVISIAMMAKEICLVVKDDGKGFTVMGGNTGFGIRGMTKRADDIAANLKISSAPGNGTSVIVTVNLTSHRSLMQRMQSTFDFLVGK
jgi:signal transduction histidine kinase